MVNCPACGSENCQKLSVIYKHGTSEATTAYKLSVEGNPFVKDNIDMGGTSQSSTAAAQEAAPPMRPLQLPYCLLPFSSWCLH